MTLADAIKAVNPQGPLVICYRTVVEVENFPSGGTEELDMFTGICRYEINGTLLSLDGDNYSLDDEICRYEEGTSKNGEKVLTVWYESEWITNSGGTE